MKAETGQGQVIYHICWKRISLLRAVGIFSIEPKLLRRHEAWSSAHNSCASTVFCSLAKPKIAELDPPLCGWATLDEDILAPSLSVAATSCVSIHI